MCSLVAHEPLSRISLSSGPRNQKTMESATKLKSSLDDIILSDPRMKESPYELFAQLRDQRPVCRVRFNAQSGYAWLITRYDDVVSVLRDPLSRIESLTQELTLQVSPGAFLARLETQIAFRTLLTHFPQMQLAVPRQQLTWRKSLLIRGLEELPVRAAA